MKKPYKTALPIPFTLLFDFVVKKVTVKGIIGKTQGVSKAIKPPSNPKRKIVRMLLFFVPSSPQSLTGLLISIVGILIRIVEPIPPSNGI